jgi:arylsulfatase A-like enzyme/tetratricopeptide (TPR) repeat protein
VLAAVYKWRAVPQASAARPVNVLLVTVDTLRADALGAYGNARAATPWMDRLAAGGLRFVSAHAHNVVTLPSHANILSGALPYEHGVRDNAGFRFPADRPTLATLLAERGHRTAAFVSAFPLDSRFGLARGFAVYDDAFVQAGTPSAFVVQERGAVETVERARRWIAAQGEAPWFCWIHVFDPHFPYEPPEPFASRFAADAYAGEVAAVDTALGPLLAPFLEQPTGRTLVVLTSDHGEALGEHGEATHGVFAYESTLRVPLLVYAAPGLAAAVREDEARHVDILPTVLDVLGLPIPPGLAGASLVRTPTAERVTYFEALSAALNRGWAPLHGVIEQGVKYVELPEPELYDIRKDSAEVSNLAATRPLDPFRQVLARFPAKQGTARTVEDAATRERLLALGYVTGAPAPSGAPATDPKHLIALDAHLQQVVASYFAGDLRGALEAARTLVARRADTVALLHLAHLEREAGDLPAAIRSLRHAHALDSSSPTVAALLGAYLTQAGRAREAADVLEAPSRAPRAEPEVLFARSLALASLGRTPESLAELEQARAADAPPGLVLLHEGTVRLMGGDRDGARRAFTAAAALEDAPARAVSSLALLDAEEGRHREALAAFERAVRADPAESARVMAAGALFMQQGRGAEARPYLELFARLAPAQRFGAELARVRAWLARSAG